MQVGYTLLLRLTWTVDTKSRAPDAHTRRIIMYRTREEGCKS